ncbi:hypothetical protein DPMN_077067 [Dreissena polymorpha]|uniref:Uncharacterized protein n=1 Tax=Dreissena polymorpha TaxID=45954 RepID=A0A9D3YL94_DREPO|nr:hypothetical protein DPMN_077067 [Dreissena polymorpha]
MTSVVRLALTNVKWMGRNTQKVSRCPQVIRAQSARVVAEASIASSPRASPSRARTRSSLQTSVAPSALRNAW